MTRLDVVPLDLVQSAVPSNTVETADIVDGAVTGAKLASGAIKFAAINGGAAGNHTVTGIAVGDELLLCLHLNVTDSGAACADIKSEMTISAANTINNTGGTNTTGGYLIVCYVDKT